VVEANGLIALMSHVRLGDWSSIVPQSLLLLTGLSHGLRALPMADPAPNHAIGLVYPDRDPVSGLISAFITAVRRQDVQQRIDAAWDRSAAARSRSVGA
jgi:DNA-binding transcriptional LysR family regulator